MTPSIRTMDANPVPSPETGLISIRFKHPFSGCRIRSLDAGCPVFFTASSVLYCPMVSSTVSTAVASATAASPARNTWTSNFSSIAQLFVPLRFAIFFYSKISIIELTPTPPTPSFPWFQPSPWMGEGVIEFGLNPLPSGERAG